MNPKNFTAILDKKRSFYGISPEQLAKVLQISTRTLARKKKNPEKFELGEVQTLIKFLRFTEEEKKEAFL
ncbi:MAG: hypothetical protein IKU42_05935 [Oscillospiraceae bacterium]|jgi:hypothetical protein|nr:hypothetical protein [Oscillospiraceae bacterium]